MQSGYKWTLLFIVVISHTALVITGEMPSQLFFLMPVTAAGYLGLIRGRKPVNRILLNVAALATLLFFLSDMFVISGDLLIAVGNLTLAFHAIKSFDIRTPGDGLQVFFMSVIQLVVASELDQPLIFGAIFLVFIASSVLFIMASHQAAQVEKMPRGLLKSGTILTLVVLPVVALIFVLMPRGAGGLFGSRNRQKAMSGFDDKVSIGTFEEVISSADVVMRITMPDGQAVEPYWRGKVFETYEKNSWESRWTHGFPYRNRKGKIQFVRKMPKNGIVQDVLLKPPKSGTVFGVSEIVSIACDSRWVVQYPNGEVAVSRRRKKRLNYQVVSTGERPEVRKRTLDLYLQFPDGMERTAKLTETITSGARDEAEKCRAIMSWLRKNCSYSLKVPLAESVGNPIEDFLFHTKKGYCEYYATAMVLMLRSVGVPARIVAGYRGGDFNPYGGYYVVRQANAHTWVEAAIGRRWARFDPTPSTAGGSRSIFSNYLDILGFAWDRYVVGYSVEDRQTLLGQLRWPGSGADNTGRLPAMAIAILIVVGISMVVGRMLFLWRRKYTFQKRMRPVSILAVQIMKWLARTYPKTADMGWRAATRKVQDISLQTRLISFFEKYEALRFGSGPLPTKEQVEELEDLARDVRGKNRNKGDG
jgi:protein-glutamine gamma-glutamyltransferase